MCVLFTIAAIRQLPGLVAITIIHLPLGTRPLAVSGFLVLLEKKVNPFQRYA